MRRPPRASSISASSGPTITKEVSTDGHVSALRLAFADLRCRRRNRVAEEREYRRVHAARARLAIRRPGLERRAPAVLGLVSDIVVRNGGRHPESAGASRSRSAMPCRSTSSMRSAAAARRTGPARRDAISSSAACIRAWARPSRSRPASRASIRTTSPFPNRTSAVRSRSRTSRSYEAGQALNYRVTRGNPLLEASQFEASFFLQNDIKLTPRATLMARRPLRRANQRQRARQHRAAGRDSPTPSASPRSFARAPGSSTVASRCRSSKTQRRLDGTRQFELIVDRAPVSGSVSGRARFETRCRPCRFSIPNLDVPEHRHRARVIRADVLQDAALQRLLRAQPRPPPASPQPQRAAPRPDGAAGPGARQHPERRVVGRRGRQHVWRLNYRHRFSIFNISSTYSGREAGTTSARATHRSRRTTTIWRRSGAGFPRPSTSSAPAVNTRLPLGLFLTGVVTANSGRAYTITTGRDDNNDTQVNDRPPGGERFGERGPAFLRTTSTSRRPSSSARPGRWRRVPDQRQRLHQHDQCVQPHEPRQPVRGDDLAEFRQIHQRGKPSRDRGGTQVPVLSIDDLRLDHRRRRGKSPDKSSDRQRRRSSIVAYFTYFPIIGARSFLACSGTASGLVMIAVARAS